MKTKINKNFDAVKYMRQERDRISKDIADMSHQQIKKYFLEKQKSKLEQTVQ